MMKLVLYLQGDCRWVGFNRYITSMSIGVAAIGMWLGLVAVQHSQLVLLAQLLGVLAALAGAHVGHDLGQPLQHHAIHSPQHAVWRLHQRQIIAIAKN